MMWHLILLNVKRVISKSIIKFLLHLLLVSVLLNHQNPFSIILPTVSFIKSLFQHILMNVEDVINQTILIKTAQSLRLINQLRFRKLSLSLIISSFIKILRHNISVVVMIMISQKIIWIFQKIFIFYKRHYKIWNII